MDQWKHLGLGCFLVFLIGCQGNEDFEALELEEGCQPLLGGVDCLLPYPSDFFLVDDSSLPSGKRISITGAAKPFTVQGESADTNDSVARDGFSRISPIVATFGQDLSATKFTAIHDDYNESLKLSHPTLLIEAETGVLVPHFVDLDPNAESPDRQALIIRPITNLKEKTRYVVAIHNLVAQKGETIKVPEGFRRLVDGQVSTKGTLAKIKEHFEKGVFSVIEEVGVKRNELQLAWDFTTGTQADVLRDMLRMRELVINKLETTAPELVSIEVEEHEAGKIWRTIRGVLKAPMVLVNQESGSDLYRDAAGSVGLNGEAEFSFIAEIPRTLKESGKAGRVLQFGHGFLGDKSEGQNGVPFHLAHEYGAVTFQIDWWGLCFDDLGAVAEGMSGNVSRGLQSLERIPQAMANWLALTYALDNTFAEHAAFKNPDNGALLFDAQHVDFLGISMGGIFGGVYAALNPRLSRIILNVGGAGFTHMMYRSSNFGQMTFMMEFPVPDPFEQQKIVAIMQGQFDRVDPSSYVQYIMSEALPGDPNSIPETRQVLLQTVLADISVPNFASFMKSRMMGAPLLVPAPVDVYGVETVTEGARNGWSLFDMGYDNSFYEIATPGGSNRGHDEMRWLPEAFQQMSVFLGAGELRHPCSLGCGPGSRLVSPTVD